MPDLKREGLIQAVEDFGVDLGYGIPGFTFDPTVVPVVGFADLALNFRPAVKAIAVARCQQAANVGTFGGCEIQAGADGFWVRNISNLSGVGINFAVNPGPIGVAHANPLLWSAWGDVPNAGALGNQLVAAPRNFLTISAQGNLSAAPLANSCFQLNNAMSPQGLFPFYVPGFASLWIQCIIVNTGVDFSVAVQFLSNSPGTV